MIDFYIHIFSKNEGVKTLKDAGLTHQIAETDRGPYDSVSKNIRLAYLTVSKGRLLFP